MKTSDEARLDVRECFEKPESTVALENMLTTLDRMKKLLED